MRCAFIAGPLHAVDVPSALQGSLFIRAQALGQDAVYRATLWWFPGGWGLVYVLNGMPIESYTPIIAHMVKEGLL